MMRRIALFGGSYNPVHVGHMMVASYVAQFTDVDEVWMSLSPLNPLKAGIASEISADGDRLAMLRIATDSSSHISVCDIELSMPQPSYTADTLRVLSSRYPDYRFVLLIGSDNWQVFDKWRDWRSILAGHEIMIYPRPGYPVGNLADYPNVKLIEAPVADLSSTWIREALHNGKDMNNFLPPGVYSYIQSHNLYR